MTSENNWFGEVLAARTSGNAGPDIPIRPAQRFREQGPGSSAPPLELISGRIVPGPQAACLSVSRLITSRLGVTPVGNPVQYDGLFGPQTATADWMDRRPGCYCETRGDTIEHVRQIRARLAA